MAQRKLPETIYGGWYYGDGPENVFLKTDADPKEMVDVNETFKVGVYKLVDYAEIKNTTTTTSETKVRELGKKRKK